MASRGQGILEGIRVIDLASGVAGQMAARILAESGADVIKVEPPDGDAARARPGFIVWNRSKRGIVLDLTVAEGRQHLDRLLAGADVLIHDLGPSAARERGLDDVTLHDHYPQLVYCGITSYPIGHPDADRKHHEPLMNARSGLMDEQMGMARKDGPIYLRAPVGTMGAWYLAAAGVMARLIARERDGTGGAAHTSLLQGALVPMGTLWSRAAKPDEAFARSLTKNNSGAAGAGVPCYQCGDGEWMHVMGPAEILPLMQTVLKELGATVPDDTAQRRATDAGWAGVGEPLREQAYRRRPRQEWLDEMWRHGIPAAPCLRIGEIYADEQAALNEYIVEVDDPRYGKTRQPGKPYVTSPPVVIKNPAPEIGQHTQEVLGEDWRARFKAHVAAHVADRGKASGRAPLDGIRVLDFGQFLAAPIAPMLMADLGAEVIKLEPTVGDGIRATPQKPWNPGRTFGGVNRGKRSIALDLKEPATRPILEKLVAWADVFHHNVRYDAAERLGLGDASLRAINTNLIYCHTSAYGHCGPRVTWPGYDPLLQAMSGWEMESAGEGNPPMWYRSGFMDFQCGLASLVATLLALYHRGKTGQAQFCSASLLGACLQTIGEVFVLPDGSISSAPQLDANQTGVSPYDRIYQCNDRYWVALYAETAAEQQALLAAFRVKQPDDLERAIGKFSQDHALFKLAQAGIPAEPVRLRGADAFLDSRVNQEAGLVAAYPHPVFGRLEQPGAYWNLIDLPLRLRPPPALGQHSREVCALLQIEPALQQQLEEQGALLQGPG